MNWDNLNLQAESTNKIEWQKFAEGRTSLRIVSPPHPRVGHWIPTAKVSVECNGADCPICEIIKQDKDAGVDSKYNKRRTWIFWGLDRADGVFKITDQGKTFMTGLQGLFEDLKEDGEDSNPANFDINIRRKGTTAQDTTYTFKVGDTSPLTDEEKEAISQLKPLKDVPLKLTNPQIIELLQGKDLKTIFSEEKGDDGVVTL